MKIKKTLVERGLFKEEISAALYKDDGVKDLLLGDTSKLKPVQIREKFKDRVKSHLFVDDTIEETATFIFYDVAFPYMRAQTKTCQVIMYLITHRDIVDDYVREGYHGNRIDILSQMVEDVLLNDETVWSFGIGQLALDSILPYNSQKFYGCIMTFSVPNFR